MRTYYIYRATNKITQESYIGQTNNFHNRKWQHERCYEKEKCKFHDAIEKYGTDNFEWEILETCDTRKKALKLERNYITLYNTYHNGYNENKGGVGGHNSIPVVCLAKDGTFVKRYDSATEAMKDGFYASSVLKSCMSETRTDHGYIFMYEKDFQCYGSRKYTPPEPTNMRSIIQCDSNGNFIQKFKSVQEASEATGANRTTISGVLSKTYKSANGFIFVYEEDFPIKDLSDYQKRKKGRKVAQVNPDTGEILKVFNRISDAGKELGVCYKGIHKVIDKPDRTAFGYKWISQ
nr:MAG TPA: intron associated endonuclease [Caudoviricetes sp.]DAO76855.1 MAG TPA: intron associated endonuclease [Caudoviricetes sp.]